MENYHMTSRKSLLYFILLLTIVGLACNAVTGTPEETAEVGLTPISDASETAAAPTPTDPPAAKPTPTDPPLGEPTPDEPPAPTEPPPGDTNPFPSLAEAVQEFDNISAAHDENPVYPDTGAPPPGGPHHPTWQNCGVYTEPVEARHVLHSLEHGAVWLAYDPELPLEDVQLLQDLAKDQAYTVMSPYPGLRSAVVLTSWGVQFETDTAADSRILEFLLTYQQGPRTPEPGAPCFSGTGLPKAPSEVGTG
jgi:hypothetical protein